MSLRSKVVAAIALAFLLLAAVNLVIQRFVVYPDFVKLEHDEAVKDAERSVAAIMGELNHLVVFAHDWAAWDDTYAYVVDRNSGYEAANLIRDTFIDAEIDIIYLFDDAGEIVWGEVRNRETGTEVKLEALPWDRPPLQDVLLNHQSPHSSVSGILVTELGPVLLASFPVVTGESRGPVQGTIIMGRVLDSKILDRLIQQTQINFNIWPVTDRGIPAEGLAALDRLGSGDGPIVIERDTGVLGVYVVQSGLGQGSDLLIGAEVARAISSSGALSTRYAAISLLLVGVVTALILLLVLQRVVVRPISELTRQLTATDDGRESAAPIAVQRSDEIGKLAASFNGLLEKLCMQRQEAIHESEERYRGLLESQPAIVYRYSRHKGASYWSSQVEDILGFSQQDLNEKPFLWHDAIHPNDLQMVDEAIAAGVDGNRIDLTYRIHDTDGSWHWLHDRSIRLLDVEGEAVIEGLAYDITTQILAEEALRESEQRYRGVVEDTPVLICRFLPGGEIIFVNKAYCRYFGKKAEELTGSNFLALIPEEDRETVMRNISALTADSPTQSHDHRVVVPDGTTRWHCWTNRALFDEDGNIVTYQSIGDDITERIRAEREIRDSHSLLKNIIEGTNEGIFLQDIAGRYQLVNPAWARLLGLPDREILGNTDDDILVPENAEILRNESQAVIAAGGTVSIEKQLNLSGRTRVLLINKSPFRDADGIIVGIIGVCRDITKLKQTQEQAQQQLEQLAHISRLSTMGEMASGIAHEINQPLHAIANFAAAADAQLAGQGPVSRDDLRELVVDISNQAVRAGEIIRRIRNLASKSKPNPSTVHINELIREVAHMVRSDIQSRNIQLNLQLGDKLPALHGDQIQIQQVVLNLLRNAFDAITEAAQPFPEVTVITALEGDEFVRITVSDNGIGLPVNEPESIFEAFVTTKDEGMGMGLAISRSIAEVHGGLLWATSNRDSGSSFHFTLRVG